MTDIEVLATGPEFLQKGIRAIEPVIEEMIMDAKSEIQVVSYVFTANALHILDLLQEAAERGVRVTIIVNNLESQEKSVVSKMKGLTGKFKHVQLIDFMDAKDKQLHAKVIVVDRAKAVVGSANFSWNGMFGNYELGLWVKGQHAWKLAKVVDILAK